jgi:hypothetical protein
MREAVAARERATFDTQRDAMTVEDKWLLWPRLSFDDIDNIKNYCILC